ncbi:MAG: protein translocase subunit SecF [Gammaproteobacteria bacterium]|nr:MAG: protein translocase subunit SecF [Gammaproteobacteria bacterium]
MQLLKNNLNFDFMGKRKLALIISLILIIISIAAMVTRGLNLGIDFTGGTLVEVGYAESVELEPVRQALASSGYDDAIVQHFGTTKDVLIRLPVTDKDADKAALSNRVLDSLVSTGAPEMRRVEFVGPQVGDELRDKGGLAMLYALVGILIYVALRFEWRFSLGSVAALIHDVIIVVGFFSITQIEFDLTVLAALLAVIGYSLNDTIVVFDRIRENFRRLRKATSEGVLNTSINQTLSRTLMTSITTLLVLAALFVFGGEVIHSFSIALIVGVIVGTYSSIYVAGSALLALDVSKEDLMQAEVENPNEDGSQV